MSINDTIRLSVIGTVSGQLHVHTLHFRPIDPVTIEQGVIDKWQALARTQFRANFNTVDSPCQSYVARHVCGTVPLRASAEEAEVAPNILGTAAKGGDSLAPWLASVTTVRTAISGRRFRGRFFLGGLYESDVSGANLVQAAQDTLQNYVNVLLAAFGPAGTDTTLRLVVFSRVLAKVPGQQCTGSATQVQTMQVRAAYKSQRSREAAHGA